MDQRQGVALGRGIEESVLAVVVLLKDQPMKRAVVAPLNQDKCIGGDLGPGSERTALALDVHPEDL